MSPDLWLILSFAVLLALGVPVAFALGLSGLCGGAFSGATGPAVDAE